MEPCLLYTSVAVHHQRRALRQPLADLQLCPEDIFPRAQLLQMGAVSYTHLDVYKRQSVNAAAGKLRESGFNVDIERATGDTVLYQYPAAGTIVPRQSTIILYSEDRSESGGDPVSYTHLDVYKRQSDRRFRP